MKERTMRNAKQPNSSRAIDRAKRIWAELDYAQRRMFEVRTGGPSLERAERLRSRAVIDELEAQFDDDQQAA
jgi:hypothetical protein